MKSFLTVLLLASCYSITAQIVINEIMYNPPESGTDSLEYIELYNNSGADINLEGYSMIGFEMDFTGMEIAADEYMVLAKNAPALNAIFGINAISWLDGALSNGGEILAVVDPSGEMVDMVEFASTGDWPNDQDGTDGEGASIELCVVDSDHNDGQNWAAAISSSGEIINDREVKGTPSIGNTAECSEDPGEGGNMGVDYPSYTITDVIQVDANGVADSIGVVCALTGVVHGGNLSVDEHIFTIIDGSNNGIGVFSDNGLEGYVVLEGDEVELFGTIGQFNGLTQLSADSISVAGMSTSLTPEVVNTLDESTESSLIKLFGCQIDDNDQWTGDGSSFNVDISCGINKYTMRIDDQTNISNSPAIIGTFGVAGIGGQFDNSEPFLEGYQIIPRYIADFDVLIGTINPAFDAAITVAPIPASDFIHIRSVEFIEKINIYSVVGELIYTGQMRQNLDVSEFESGVYFLELRSEDKRSVKRIVKE